MAGRAHVCDYGPAGCAEGIVAAVAAVGTYIGLYMWSTLINRLNELAPEYYEGMFFLSFVSAAVHMADRFVKDAQLEIEFLPAQGEIPVLLPKQVLRRITIILVKKCAVHANATRLPVSMSCEVREQQVHYQVLFEDDG